MRIIRPLTFLVAAIVGVVYVALDYHLPIEWASFALGIAVAGLVGLLEMQIGNWWSAVKGPYEPQTVKLKTKETPAQITGAATKARFIGALVFTALVAVGIVWFHLKIFNVPNETWSILIIVFGVAFIAPMFMVKRSAE
jgi:hypothetical protein